MVMALHDVVVTVGHKVKNFVNNPSGLTVRLGDWNPNTRDNKEEHPHIEKSVECVRIHPDADLESTLANNVAVLKLSQDDEIITTSLTNAERAVASVIDLKSAPDRPGQAHAGLGRPRQSQAGPGRVRQAQAGPGNPRHAQAGF